MRIGFILAALIALSLATLQAVASPVTIGQSQVDVTGPWRFQVGDDPRWADPAFNDAQWATFDLTPEPGAHDSDVGLSRYVPGWWARGFPKYEGYAWYRTRLTVTAPPGTKVSLLAPPYVEDAFQVFWDGKLIGESGRFITGATPSVRSTKPRIFSLDTQGLPDREHVLAIRVWMAPGQEREPDAGGIHIAPRIGDHASIEASYQLQWLETFKGYVVDVIEPLAFLLLAVLAWIARKVLSTRFALSLAVALILTAALRINQALYFWFDFESQAAFGVAKYATLEPLGLFAWVVAWSEWTQSKDRKRIQQTALAFAAMTVMAVVVELEWLRTATRLASGMLLILAACIGWRARRPDRLLAAVCIALIAIGQFAEELWRIGVPGIWFPFGTGVSRTQFAYAAFVVAMTAFLMRCLTRADAWSLSCRSQLQR